MDSKEDKDRKHENRRSDYSDGGGGRSSSFGRNSNDRQDSWRYRAQGTTRYNRRGDEEDTNNVSRNYTDVGNSSGGPRYHRQYDRKRSRSRERDRSYHSGRGSNRDHSPDRRGRDRGSTNYSHDRSSDSRKRPMRDSDEGPERQEPTTSEEIDEEDLRPVTLNISCPAATTLVQQIEKRKLLFSKKTETPVTSTSGSSSSVWQKTTFSDDSDGKVSAKFKRLMGMKEGGETGKGQTKDAPLPATQSKDFFNKLEKQYEVARTITHTQRGVGLGFGSSGGLVPRTNWTNKP